MNLGKWSPARMEGAHTLRKRHRVATLAFGFLGVVLLVGGLTPTTAEEIDTPAISEPVAAPDEAPSQVNGVELDDELGLDDELVPDQIDIVGDLGLGLDGELGVGELLLPPAVSPFALDAAPPYLAWTAVDGAGNPLGGATFGLQGRQGNNWGQSISVKDNGPYDLDARDGYFIVKNIGVNQVQQGSRYRLQPEGAPVGYTAASTSAVEVPSNAWNADGTYTFPNAFRFLNGHTIVVKKADMRTGLGVSAVSPQYVEGARFALYTSQNATNPVSNQVCEIAAGSTQCIFEGVPTNTGGYWVGEIAPAPGTPAAFNYSDPISQLRTSSTVNYRYSTGAVSGSFSTYTVPRSGNNPSATSGYFANRIANPPLIQTCDAGVNVALVMDLSGSIAGSQNDLAKSASGLVDGLTGTDSSVALFSFSTESPATQWSGGNTNNVLIPNRPTPQSVATQAGADIVKSWFSNDGGQTANFTPSGGTNWDAALYNVAQNVSAHDYDIVFMLTDGDPTFSSSANAGGREGNGSATTFREVERAVLAANVIKDKGTRVVSVGVGPGVQNSAVNLAAISGPQSSGASLSDIDYTITGWNELAKLLKDFAQEISCQATVTVEKLTVEGEGAPALAKDWEFTTTATGAEISPEEVQKTSDDGSAKWNLQFGNPSGSTSVNITETGQEGWSLENLVCKLDDEDLQVDLDETVTINGVGIGDNVHCVFTNQKAQSTLTLIKEIEGEELGGDLFDPDANVNQWTLTAERAGEEPINGATGDPAVTNAAVEPGEYTLSEALQGNYADKAYGYELKSLTCVDTAKEGAEPWEVYLDDAPEDGPGIARAGTVDIKANENIECTFLNSTLPGSIAWDKVAENGTPLKDSVWKLEGPGTSDVRVDITGSDTGNFLLENLVWGNYTLTETEAPAGFEWDEEVGPQFTVELTPSNLNWKATSEGGHPIINKQVRPVTLPIAGGSGTWMYIGGGMLLLLVGAGGWLLVTRRQQSIQIVSGDN